MDGFITRVWTFQQKLDWYASENREQALRTMHASMTKRMSHAMLQSMQTIGRNWDMELPTKMRDLQQSERCAPTPSMQLQVQIADIKAMKWTLICLELCILTLNHPIPLCPHRGIGTGSSANHNQAKKKGAQIIQKPVYLWTTWNGTLNLNWGRGCLNYVYLNSVARAEVRIWLHNH